MNMRSAYPLLLATLVVSCAAGEEAAPDTSGGAGQDAASDAATDPGASDAGDGAVDARPGDIVDVADASELPDMELPDITCPCEEWGLEQDLCDASDSDIRCALLTEAGGRLDGAEGFAVVRFPAGAVSEEILVGLRPLPRGDFAAAPDGSDTLPVGIEMFPATLELGLRAQVEVEVGAELIQPDGRGYLQAPAMWAAGGPLPNTEMVLYDDGSATVIGSPASLHPINMFGAFSFWAEGNRTHLRPQPAGSVWLLHVALENGPATFEDVVGETTVEDDGPVEAQPEGAFDVLTLDDGDTWEAEVGFACAGVGSATVTSLVDATVKQDERVFGVAATFSSDVLCDAIEGGQVVGSAFLDLDGDGEFDEDEEGAEGVEVTVARVETDTVWPILGRFRSDDTGVYKARSLPAGTYEVTLSTERLPRAFAAEPFSERLRTGPGLVSQVTAIPISVDGSISGVVFNDTDNDGVLDAGEPVMEDVAVRLDRLDSAGEVAATVKKRTNTQGEYLFPLLGPSTFVLSIELESLPAGLLPRTGVLPWEYPLGLGEAWDVPPLAVSTDADDDGLSNEVELTIGTSPILRDTDSDGLTDGEEVNTVGSDPTDPDSDDDGLFDGTEVLFAGSDPRAPNSDGDSLSDWDEVMWARSDASKVDSDGDGLDDDAEIALGTDPRRTDTDGDDIEDDDEVSLGTDPLVADTDGDGFDDGVELGAGTPLNSDDDGRINAVDLDSDGDGMSDLTEWVWFGGGDRLTHQADDDELPNVYDADSDGDGTDDGEDNCPFTTNSGQADEDGDGIGDACAPSGETACPEGGATAEPVFLGSGEMSSRHGATLFAQQIGSAAGDRYTAEVCPGGRLEVQARFEDDATAVIEATNLDGGDFLVMSDPGAAGLSHSANYQNDGDEVVELGFRVAVPGNTPCRPYVLQARTDCGCPSDRFGPSTSDQPIPVAGRGVLADMALGAGQDDWFEVPVCANGKLEVTAYYGEGEGEFTATLQDLDLNALPTELLEPDSGVGLRFDNKDGPERRVLLNLFGNEDACRTYRLDLRQLDCLRPDEDFDLAVFDRVSDRRRVEFNETHSETFEVCAGGVLDVEVFLYSPADPREPVIRVDDGDVFWEDVPHSDYPPFVARQIQYLNDGDTRPVEVTVAPALAETGLTYALLPRLSCPCSPADALEDNNEPAAASQLDPLSQTLADLSSGALDTDWYDLELCEQGVITVSSTTDSSGTDLTNTLFVSDSEIVLAEADPVAGRRRFSWTNPSNHPLDLTMRTEGLAPSLMCADYSHDIVIDCPCLVDPLEPDDTVGEATLVEAPGAHYERLRSTHGDPDYFVFAACGGGTVDVSAEFYHSQGDLTLLLMRSDLNLAGGLSSTDNEAFTYAIPAGLPFQLVLQVKLDTAGGLCPIYDLDIELDCPLDTDGDFLADSDELRLGSQIDEKDSDEDGLEDGEEVYLYLTNPVVSDSDTDRLKDGDEVYLYETNPALADSDGGGLEDGDEVLVYITDPSDQTDDLILITPNPLPSAVVGVPYDFTFQAVGGTEQHLWTAVGDLPFGRIERLGASAGRFFGTPVQAANDTVTVRLENGDYSIERTFDILIRN